MTDGGYNGWSNYETWVANLELCEDIARMWDEDGQRFDTVGELRDAFRDAVAEYTDAERAAANLPELSVMYSWAVRALERVDWWEIAEHYAEELIAAPLVAESGD